MIINKKTDSLDMNHMLQDILTDKSTSGSKFLKYEKLKEDYQNEEKNHIYNHYKTFIEMTEQLKNMQGSVGQMKQFFSEYEPLLKSLGETLKNGDHKMPIFYMNIHNKEGDIDSNKVMEEIQKETSEKVLYDLTEKLNGVIDKFELSIYEKNYTECVKIYRFFKALKSSNKYSELISGYELRKNIDFHYNRLVESLISDLFNETTKNTNDIINSLKDIGQAQKAKLAVLDIRSKQLREKINSLIDDTKEYDKIFFETVTREFFDEALSCLNYLEKTFKDSSCMSSFSIWVNTELINFYSIIAPIVYESDDLQVAIYYLKKICMVFIEKQNEMVSLSTEFEKLALKDIQDSLDELCKNLVLNLKTCVTGEDYNLYSFFSITNMLEYDIEILETASLIDIDKKNNSFKSQNEIFFENINEGYIVKNIGEIIQGTDLDLKLTRSMNYFWNAMFFLIDFAYEAKDTDNIPIISSRLFSLIQFKLESLAENLFKFYFEILDEKTSKTENQVLSYLTSLYYSKILADNLDKILLFKFPKLYKNNPSWKKLSNSFAKKYQESIAIYTQMTVLGKVPLAIIKNTEIYKRIVSTVIADKPTKAFSELAKAFEKANKNIGILLGPEQKEGVLSSMFESCLLCLEYSVLCRENLAQNKREFYDKTVLDCDSIQRLMLRNSFKITDCSVAGLYQLIYDVNFLGLLYQRLIGGSMLTNIEGCVSKLVGFYKREKNIPENIEFRSVVFQDSLERFFETEYKE